MIYEIDYKVPNGKLLRIQADLYGDTISSIKIFGDFFIHPETAILDIEKFLVGVRVMNVTYKLDKIIKKRNITLLGFNSAHLTDALKRMTK